MQKLVTVIYAMFSLSAAAQVVTNDTITAKKIDSVIVSSKKPFVENQLDKTIIHVDSRPSTAGQNALELLKAAPSVVVDGNENIKMGGKNGVQILIDGRNTNMSSQDIAQLLKTIEASNVKEIELISNPSSKYDAAGNAGIINIKLKKSITNGFNGNTNIAYQQSVHARQNSSAAFNFRHQKINWFANLGYNSGTQHTIANNDRVTNNKVYTQRGIEKDVFNSNNIRTGIDYSISKKHTVGVLFMQNASLTTMDNSNKTTLSNLAELDTTVITRSLAPFTNKRRNANINYAYNSTKGTTINIDADIASFNSTLYNTVSSQLYNASNAKFTDNATQNNADVVITINSLKADFTQKLKENSNLEAGVKLVSTTTHNNLAVLKQYLNNWQNDTSSTNLFNFKEQVSAAYANYNTQYKKLSIQAGLRAEYTRVNGISTNLRNEKVIKPDTGYLNLFPTLFAQYNLANNHQLGFYFGKRIDRPSYQDQNPFIYMLDAFNIEMGNPYLKPQISHAVELSYTYKYATSVKLKYAITNNYIEQLTYQNGSSTILIPQNAGNRKMINLAISTPLQPTKWWNAYLSAEPYWQQHNTIISGFKINTTTQQSSFGFNGYIGNWITLPKNYKVEISGWFSFQNTTTIYTAKPLGSINIGLSKSLLQNKATIKLAITDIANTQRWQQQVSTPQLQMNTYRKWESRNVSISLSYRFGNAKIKDARQRDIGSEGELGRIKSK